jgi:hypothetical protein
MSNSVNIRQLAENVKNALSTQDTDNKWEENSIKSLLELGKFLSSISGMTNDKVGKHLKKEDSGLISLTREESLKLAAIFETVNSKYRDKVSEDDNIKLPVYQYFFSPIKLALCAFKISDLGPTDSNTIEGLSSGLSQSIDTCITRAEKLNAAKQGIDELTDYSNSHFSDSGIDQLAGKKKESVSHIATSFRSRAYDYVGGDNEAFKSFNTTNVKPIKILSDNRQAKNIIASIMLSLTGIGLVVGIAQYCYSGNFLFCKTKSHSIVEDNVIDQFPKV